MLSLVQCDIETLDLVAPSGGVTKDVPLLIGGLCVIPVNNAVAGALFAAKTQGVFKLPKHVGTAMAAGDLVEWSVSGGEVIANGGATGNFDLGYVVTAALSAETQVVVAKVLSTSTAN